MTANHHNLVSFFAEYAKSLKLSGDLYKVVTVIFVASIFNTFDFVALYTAYGDMIHQRLEKLPISCGIKWRLRKIFSVAPVFNEQQTQEQPNMWFPDPEANKLGTVIPKIMKKLDQLYCA